MLRRRWSNRSRRTQRGYISVGLRLLLSGRRSFRLSDIFGANEPGFHAEVYDPSTLLQRRNLMLWSEDFGNAAHSQLNASIPFDAVEGAYKLTEDATTGQHQTRQNFTAAPDHTFTYTFSTRVKSGGRTKVALEYGTGGSGAVAFNLATGLQLGATVGVVTSFGIEAAPDAPGYYDIWMTYPRTASTVGVAIVTLDDTSTGPSVGKSYAGDTAKGVYVKRIQHERGARTAYQKVTDWNAEVMAAALDRIAMWKDDAATEPATAVEQTVGVWADTKNGGTRGPNVAAATYLTTPTFDNVTTPLSATSFSVTGGTTSSRAALNLGATAAGETWECYCRLVSVSSGTVQMSGKASTDGTGGIIKNGAQGAAGQMLHFQFATTSGQASISWVSSVAGASFVVDQIVARRVPGNHATQATPNSRPVLSARYNLLLKSEQFSDALWSKRGTAAVVAGATASPRAGSLADQITVGLFGTNDVYQTVPGLPVSVPLTASVRIKRISTSGVLRLQNATSSTAGNWTVDLALLSDAWETLTAAHPAVTVTTAYATTASGGAGLQIGCTTATNISFYLWGADQRTTNDAALNQPAYQRVNTPTDYDTVGFIHYLKFDGLDDSLSTGNIDYSGVDKMTVWLGQTKLSDAAAGLLVELTASSSSTVGSFGVIGPTGAASTNYEMRTHGTVQRAARTVSPYAGPVTALLTMMFDNAAATSEEQVLVQVNGAAPAVIGTSIGPTSPGPYSNAPFHIGRRAGSTSPFNGRMTSVTARGSTSPTAARFIAGMNRYAAQLAGQSNVTA
ncbi:MAG TPA: hypothetical protein VIL30_09655 [Ramlibacter sp.]|jgi:hypothetical protein